MRLLSYAFLIVWMDVARAHAMTFRFKVFLASVVQMIAFMCAWAVVVFFFKPFGDPLPALVALILTYVLSEWLVHRAFRCPHCSKRLGWWSITRTGFPPAMC